MKRQTVGADANAGQCADVRNRRVRPQISEDLTGCVLTFSGIGINREIRNQVLCGGNGVHIDRLTGGGELGDFGQPDQRKPAGDQQRSTRQPQELAAPFRARRIGRELDADRAFPTLSDRHKTCSRRSCGAAAV